MNENDNIRERISLSLDSEIIIENKFIMILIIDKSYNIT